MSFMTDISSYEYFIFYLSVAFIYEETATDEYTSIAAINKLVLLIMSDLPFILSFVDIYIYRRNRHLHLVLNIQ